MRTTFGFHQRVQHIVWSGLLLLISTSCTPSDSPSDDAEGEPTPEPGPSLRKTTWSSYLFEHSDPRVSADTVLFFNVETQQEGRVTGWFWHIWGDLSLDGYEVPENQVVALEGTYTWERHLVLTGSLYGHTAQLDALIWESGDVAELTLTLDTDQYEKFSYWSVTDYVTVYPD